MGWIDGVTGNEIILNYHVPQGSVLDSVIYILYIDSLCNSNIEGLIVIYTDDTCYLFSGDSRNELRIKAAK